MVSAHTGTISGWMLHSEHQPLRTQQEAQWPLFIDTPMLWAVHIVVGSTAAERHLWVQE